MTELSDKSPPQLTGGEVQENLFDDYIFNLSFESFQT